MIWNLFFCITGHLWGKPVTSGFPSQRINNAVTLIYHSGQSICLKSSQMFIDNNIQTFILEKRSKGHCIIELIANFYRLELSGDIHKIIYTKIISEIREFTAWSKNTHLSLDSGDRLIFLLVLASIPIIKIRRSHSRISLWWKSPCMETGPMLLWWPTQQHSQCIAQW